MTRLARLALVGLVAGVLGLTGSVAEAQGNAFSVDPNLAERGRKVFLSPLYGCYLCHSFGRRLAGPDLTAVAERRDHDWLRRFLKETEAMLLGDPQARALLEEWKGVRMPQFKISDADINALIHYFQAETQRVRGG